MTEKQAEPADPRRYVSRFMTNEGVRWTVISGGVPETDTSSDRRVAVSSFQRFDKTGTGIREIPVWDGEKAAWTTIGAITDAEWSVPDSSAV